MGAGLDPGRKGNEFSESFLATSFFFLFCLVVFMRRVLSVQERLGTEIGEAAEGSAHDAGEINGSGAADTLGGHRVGAGQGQSCVRAGGARGSSRLIVSCSYTI